MSPRRDTDVPSTSSRPASAGRNLIAAIGIDVYHHWRTLQNAVQDANGVLALFRQLGFAEITPPLFNEDATGTAIRSLVTDDLTELRADDSLVLFYAGHGTTRNQEVGEDVIKTGYLIPVNADGALDKVASWVNLDDWLRAVSRLRAKHILVILDACHSGIALNINRTRDLGVNQGEPPEALRMLRSRKVITSVLAHQVASDNGPVPGHSLFTRCLIETLTHGIGDGNDREITGSALGAHVQGRVRSLNRQQTPDFGPFELDARGEMMIPLLAKRRDGLDRRTTHDPEPEPRTRPSQRLEAAPPCAPEHNAKPAEARAENLVATTTAIADSMNSATWLPGGRTDSGRLPARYPRNPAWLVDVADKRLYTLASPTYVNLGPRLDVASLATANRHLHISAEGFQWYVTAHGCRLVMMNSEPDIRTELCDGQTLQVEAHRFVFRCVVSS